MLSYCPKVFPILPMFFTKLSSFLETQVSRLVFYTRIMLLTLGQ